MGHSQGCGGAFRIVIAKRLCPHLKIIVAKNERCSSG